jgi:hypothetical protein
VVPPLSAGIKAIGGVIKAERAVARLVEAEDGLMAFGAIKKAAKVAKAGEERTEIVQRAMSKAELEATRSTGLLRGGRDGTHYVSDAVNSTASKAQSRLALPVRPEVRVKLEVPAGRFSAPTRVQPLEVAPGKTLPGGGMERSATGQVPARVLTVDEL